MIYLDHAGSTQMVDSAISIFQDSLREDFANSSSAHKLGKKQKKIIETIHGEILNSVKGRELYSFVFTSSATEANNLFIQGVELSPGAIVANEGDHPSLYKPLLRRAHSEGRGLVNKFEEGEEIALLGGSWVNGLDGSTLDLSNYSKQFKEKNPDGKLFIDGSQGFGKFKLDLSEGNIDGLSISAHKMGGPKGISGLFLKKNALITPLWLGGGHQEGLRPSTLPTSLCRSFFSAIQYWEENRDEIIKKVSSFSNYLREELAEDVEFLNRSENRSPFIELIKIPGISSDILLRSLEEKEVYISSSSACSSRIKGENPSYTSLGIDPQFHKNLLRISYGASTSLDEVKKFVLIFKNVLKDLSFLIK